MICFPNAKINLGLNIVSKREDGYHNLETVFYPIGVKDALEVIVKEGADTFTQLGSNAVDVPTEDNLVMKALRLMREHYDFPPVEVQLLKKIPSGAGIGGGSADAAFMLHLLNDTFSLKASDEQLARLAVQLGADCPFFIYNKPMYAEGIGEELTPIDLSLKGYYLVLIKPDIHISTKDAFAHIRPEYPAIPLQEIIKKPVEEWKNLMVNDFEENLALKYPRIEKVKTELYKQGAIYASMTGSGSSVYGLFKEEVQGITGLFNNDYVWQQEFSK